MIPVPDVIDRNCGRKPELGVPGQVRGQDADIITAMLLMEGLGQGCKDSGLLFAMNGQVLTVQMPILLFGTEAQRERYLPPMCSGEWIGAHGMTESRIRVGCVQPADDRPA